MPILFYVLSPPYEPPLGDSVNFFFEGGYSPPDGEGVDFEF